MALFKYQCLHLLAFKFGNYHFTALATTFQEYRKINYELLLNENVQNTTNHTESLEEDNAESLCSHYASKISSL